MIFSVRRSASVAGIVLRVGVVGQSLRAYLAHQRDRFLPRHWTAQSNEIRRAASGAEHLGLEGGMLLRNRLRLMLRLIWAFVIKGTPPPLAAGPLIAAHRVFGSRLHGRLWLGSARRCRLTRSARSSGGRRRSLLRRTPSTSRAD